jgi:hypothetical protein
VEASSIPTRRQRAEELGAGIASMRTWPMRRWLVAIAVGVLAALAIGVPTGIVQTSFYTRMTPVTWWNYPVWAISALLVGLTAATYLRESGAPPTGPHRGQRTIGAAVLSSFAVGCPICNKLVVGLIGASGALNYWAPLQPVLGILSIALLLGCLAVRLRGAVACPSPTSAAAHQ